MSKVQLLRLINAILIISFVVQALTSIIIFFKIKLPNVRAIFEIHEFNGMLMITLVIIHLILNWGWVKASFFTKR